MKYKRGKKKTKLPDLPKNGWWSRMIHKGWMRDLVDKKLFRITPSGEKGEM